VQANRADKQPAHALPPRPVKVAGLAPAVRPTPAHPGIVISERDRDAVYDYYGTRYTPGACPAGLVKRPDGCLPGEPRGEWTMGEPLPDDVLSYPLPAVLLGQLTPPPSGYEYNRVGRDVLILHMDTRVVVGALASPDDD
jgi:hypothetical protein